MSDTAKITETRILEMFNPNWVFKLYSWIRFHYIVLSLMVSIVPLLIGLILSLFWRASLTYITNLSLWLNTFAIFLAFTAFGWFTHKLPDILVPLSEVFNIDDDEYGGIIKNWANRFANRNWLMPIIALLFAIPNLMETVDIWGSSKPPILLDPWVNSPASGFFEVFYGFLHGILVPLILGSGLVGMIGVVGLLFSLFQKPLKLAFYRRTSIVIELTSWLMMWALIGLASILLFGRSLFVMPVDIPFFKVSALIQSVPATLIILIIGSLPLILISNAIGKAKRKELNRLEVSYGRIHARLMANLEKSPGEEHQSQSVKDLDAELEIIIKQIKQIEDVPALPIQWPSVTRVSLSALFSIGSPLIEDWWKDLVDKVI
jgi:MFS family permease